MEFWIYFGLYTFLIVIIWGFFIIAKIHSLKFKNYQPKIIWITRMVNIFLILFTVLWYILISIYAGGSRTYTVKDSVEKKENIESSISNFNNISEKDIAIPDNAGDNYY